MTSARPSGAGWHGIYLTISMHDHVQNRRRFSNALTRKETGWLRQHPNLASRVRPIDGLVSQTDIDRARTDWDDACDVYFKHASSRVKEIQRVARVHRDPFEPIMPVLEADSPVGEYRKITKRSSALCPTSASIVVQQRKRSARS